jgi:hypothetical protein
MKILGGVTAVSAFATLALLAPAAQATNFCVPTIDACAGNPGVVKTDLEEAMGSNGTDGQADTVYLAAGTFTENASYEPSGGFKNPGTIEPQGSDPLTVVGVGTASVVTSAGSGNIYLMALGSGAREVVLRDLTLRVPTTFGSGNGAALQMSEDDRVEDVAVVSLNSGSDGIVAVGSGNEVHTSVLRGEGGGSIDDGVNTFFGGEVTVEDTKIVGASWPLITSDAGSTLTARRVSEVGTRTYGAIVSGGSMRIENSIFRLDDGIGLYVSASTTDALLEADHLTVVNDGSTYPALEGKKFSNDAGDATMVVTNSIFRGFSSGYRTDTAFGPGIGLVKLTARYSNLPSNGLDAGGTADFSAGNIDADPLFNADLSLPANSPSVDAGDPAPGGLAADFLGAPRPDDGNGDGLAVRDQGAFEYQRPVAGGGSGGGKNPEPRVIVDRVVRTFITAGPGKKLAQGKARFGFRSNVRNPRFQCQLDKRKVRPCAPPKLYKRLKPGRHVFKVWAIAGFGKDHTPAKKRFRVPA